MTNNTETIRCPVCLKMTAKAANETWKEYVLFKCRDCDVVFSHPFIAGDTAWYVESGNYELARFHKKPWTKSRGFFFSES